MPVRQRHEAEYEAFVLRHRGRLLATATHLTGDGHLAEDLVQSALVRLYLAWGRARAVSTEGYARRILVNSFIDHQRRPWVRQERAVDVLPDVAMNDANSSDADLLAALAGLPPRMRAAVILRHVEDLSVEETADALGCSVGTVKSQTARGLEKLRAILPNLERNPS